MKGRLLVTAGLVVLALASAAAWSPRSDALSAGAASGATGALVPQGLEKIEHIIVIVQENRSFDHYFGTYPGADGIPMSHGRPRACVPNPFGPRCGSPYHSTNLLQKGGPHDHPAARTDVNGGKMNGFLRALGTAKYFCHVSPSRPGCRAYL